MVGSDKQGPDGPAAEVSDQHPAVAEVSDGQPAMPEVSDSAVPEVSDSAVPDLSDRQPPDAAGHDMYDEVDVEYDQADVEMQAQEGPKPGMEDLLLAPKSQSDDVLCDFALGCPWNTKAECEPCKVIL